MDHIGKQLGAIEQNIKINSADPIALHGFTQVPNFILKNPEISIGAKKTYALFLSYAWHNHFCFPGRSGCQRTWASQSTWTRGRSYKSPKAMMRRLLLGLRIMVRHDGAMRR